MKRTIFHLWQTCGLRLAVCTITFGLTTAIYAQTDNDEFEEETVTTIKQPKRAEVKQKVYLFRLKIILKDHHHFQIYLNALIVLIQLIQHFQK